MRVRVRVPTWLRRGAGLVIVLLVLEYLVVPQIAGARKTLHLLSNVHPAWVALATVLEGASLVSYGALTRVVLPRDGRPDFWTLLRIDLTSFGVSHVIPGGAATAGALRYRLLTEAGVRASDAVLGASVEGVGSAAVLNVMLLGGLLGALFLHGGDILYGIAAGCGAALLVMATALVLALTRGDERSVRVVRAVAARVPRLSPDRAERVVRTFAARLRELGSDRKRLLSAVAWASANWVLDALSLWVFVLAFGHTLGPDGLLVSFGLANVLAVLPITPGGLGIVEGVLVPTMVAFQTPRGIAILGVVTYRLVQFWLPIPVSGLTYLSLRAGPLRHARARHAVAEADRPWKATHTAPDAVERELARRDRPASTPM